ncbi:MAG: hypothetical protein ACM3O4_03590 [Ignavibacteriales bacterium]
MYNIDYKNLRKEIYFGLPFILVGLLFFILLCFLTFSGLIKKMSMDKTVEAYKIDENGHYDSDGAYLYSPIFYYSVNGKEYECRINYSSSSGVNSKQKNVYYNSANPQDCVTDYTVKPEIFMYFLCLFPIIFILVGFIQVNKCIKQIKKIKDLNMHGKLIKNLPYELVNSNYSINNRNIRAIKVIYKLPNGVETELIGNPRFDGKMTDEDGFVDLLIDEQNPENYYIDFNIN